MGLLRALTPALDAMAWNPLRMTHTPFVVGTVFDWGPQVLDGWYGIDQFDERIRYSSAFWTHSTNASGAARCICIPPLARHGPVDRSWALARSRRIKGGLKLGLEQIRMLPAAVGSEGNIMSFWRHDHRAWKGKFWVIRRIGK